MVKVGTKLCDWLSERRIYPDCTKIIQQMDRCNNVVEQIDEWEKKLQRISWFTYKKKKRQHFDITTINLRDRILLICRKENGN